MDPLHLELLNRSLGPVCSNEAHFLPPDSSTIYRAYGVPGGHLIIQSLNLKDNRHRPYETQSVLFLPPDIASGKIDNVKLVSWGGGQFLVSAAAAGQSISIFGNPGQAHTSTSKGGANQKSEKTFSRICGWDTDSQPVGLDWTQDTRGLIVSQASGSVCCVRVGVNLLTKAKRCTDLSRTSGKVLDRSCYPVAETPLRGTIEIIWEGNVGSAHSLVAGGPSILEPSATASPDSDSVAVWWPGEAGDHRREMLKHPGPIVAIDWSPRHDSTYGHSALVSSCRDGAIRVWIKFAHSSGKSVGVNLPDEAENSLFCLALVVEPPLDFVPQESTFQGAWAKRLPSNPSARDVLWIVALHKKNGSREDKAYLSLVAVDGLINVSISSSHSPRKIPWGQTEILNDPGGKSSISAMVFSPEPTPELLVMETTWNEKLESMSSQIMLLNCSRRQLSKILHRNFLIEGPLSDIESLVMHPSQDLMCIINEDTSIGIWDIWPLYRMAKVAPGMVDLPNGIRTATWIPCSSTRCSRHLMLSGIDGVSLCEVSIDEKDQFHRMATVTSVVLKKLASERLTTQVVPLNEGSIDDGIFWFLFLGSQNPIFGQLLKLSIHKGVDPELNIFDVDIPLDSLPQRNTSITTLTSVSWERPAVALGDSQGKLFFLEVQPDSREVVQSTCKSLESNGEIGGVIQAMEMCGHAPYLACTTVLGPEGCEDSLWILRIDSTKNSLSSFVETRVNLESTPADLAWMNGCSLVMAVIVSFQAGGVEVWAQASHGSWERVARHNVGLPITCMVATHKGYPVIAAGINLLVLARSSESFGHGYFLGDSVAGCSLAIGGPQSNYHPDYIAPVINAGFTSIISGVAASLAEWLDCFESSRSNCVSSILGPCSRIDSAIGHRFSKISINLDESVKTIQSVPYSKSDSVSQPGACALEKKRSLFSSSRLLQSPVDVSQQSPGLLNMSALGMGDSFANNSMGFPKKQAPKAPPPSLEFDPSAFGLDETALAPQPTENGVSELSASHTANSAVENGLAHSASYNNRVVDSPSKDQEQSQPNAVENGSCDEREQSSNDAEEEHALETCVALDKSAIAVETSTSPPEKKLDKETAAVLAKYSDPTSTRVNVAEVAEILGVPEIKFCSACSMLLSGLTQAEGPAGRLDAAGNVMLAAVRVATAMSICPPEATGEESNNVGFSGVQFKSMTRVQSFQSIPSIAASWSTCMPPDNSARGSNKWPERVGLYDGIQSAHLLWAAQSSTKHDLLAACLRIIHDAPAAPPSAALRSGSFGPFGSQSFQQLCTKKVEHSRWEKLRSVGIGFWLSDPTVIANIWEDLAREEFAETRDPHKCALMYVALGKQRLLGTLFRGAGRTRVADLLGRNFDEEINRKTAAKNAYVLLGKHQHSLAAAFFLLGKHYEDCIGVCTREMGDPQLGLFLSVLIDRSGTSFRRTMIEKVLIPEAIQCKDRSAHALLMWMMGEYPGALKELVNPQSIPEELALSQQKVIGEVLTAKFVLDVGLSKLAGRNVPTKFFEDVLQHIQFCAHILRISGSPVLGILVLESATRLKTVQELLSKKYSTGLKQVELQLVSSLMIKHLPDPQAVCDRDPQIITWREEVKEDIELLRTHGLSVDDIDVIRSLERLMASLYEFPAVTTNIWSPKMQPTLGAGPPLPSSSSVRMPIALPGEDGLLYNRPREVLHMDGDACTGVCCSQATQIHCPGRASHLHRVAVGTNSFGMHYVDWGPAANPNKGEFDHSLHSKRWPKNPWLGPGFLRKMSTESAVAARVLKTGRLHAHPCSDMFLSGGRTSAVQLWKFGESTPRAYFSPRFRGSSVVGGWVSPRGMCWNSSGDRIAAVGRNGSCATWQLGNGSPAEAHSFASWQDLVGTRRGRDIQFVDGSGSILIVSGEDDSDHGNLRIWDTLSPRIAAEVSHCELQGVVSHMSTVPGTQILLSGISNGAVMAHDIRMLEHVLWKLPAHHGPVSSMATGWGPFGRQGCWELVMATGGKDGDICIMDNLKGLGTLRQRIEKAHWKKTANLSNFLGNFKSGRSSPESSSRLRPSGAHGAPVLDLDWCDDGLLTGGADGYLHMFSWQQG